MDANPLLEQDVAADPLRQFGAWFAEAAAAGIRMPEAMALATASEDAVPSVRMLLLKGFDERGFVFYTGRRSRKGRELAENPVAALLFYWAPLGRQVRVEGFVERLPADESDAYFAARPRASQLSAAASVQGEVVGSRAELEERVARLRAELGEEPLARPAHWGGYRVQPDHYEFWQHRADRLHDRLRYVRAGDAWRIERLAP